MRIWWLLTALFARTAPARKTPPASTTATTPDGLCASIAACAATVTKTLGSGLPEIIYENALAHELRKQGLAVAQQHAVAVCYDGMIVGDYTADLLVDDSVLVKLKSVNTRNALDPAGCQTYLNATSHTDCMLFNFGTSPLQTQCVTTRSNSSVTPPQPTRPSVLWRSEAPSAPPSGTRPR
jgi:GxxExxY protein